MHSSNSLDSPARALLQFLFGLQAWFQVASQLPILAPALLQQWENALVELRLTLVKGKIWVISDAPAQSIRYNSVQVFIVGGIDGGKLLNFQMFLGLLVLHVIQLFYMIIKKTAKEHI